MNPDDLATFITKEAAAEIRRAFEMIRHCVKQLSDDQIWWRPGVNHNSIANLMLHITGNLRQWMVAGLSDVPDIRNRAAEFAERGPIPKETLLQQMEAVVVDAEKTLARQSAADLARVRTIMGLQVSGAYALFRSIPHFRGHAQEIVHITRIQLQGAYEFMGPR